jgi:hypothetical protein
MGDKDSLGLDRYRGVGIGKEDSLDIEYTKDSPALYRGLAGGKSLGLAGYIGRRG